MTLPKITCFFILFTLFMSIGNSQSTIYYEDCNTLDGWTNTGAQFHGLINVGGDHKWYSVDPITPEDDHTGGGNCFYVNGNAIYQDAWVNHYILYRIESPVINIKGHDNCVLEFWMQLRSEVDNWDGAFIDWSHDGVIWTQFTNSKICPDYDGKMSRNDASTPYFKMLKPAWFNYRITWTRVLIDLSEIDDVKNFQLRFTFHSDEYEVYQGWAIDDIKILSTSIPVVKGNGNLVKKNDNSPKEGNNTDFGKVKMGTTAVRKFSFYNPGPAPLQLTGIPFVKATGDGFLVIKQPSTKVVEAGSSVSFDVQFTSGMPGIATGIVNGSVTIPCSTDSLFCDPQPYTFAIKANSVY